MHVGLNWRSLQFELEIVRTTFGDACRQARFGRNRKFFWNDPGDLKRKRLAARRHVHVLGCLINHIHPSYGDHLRAGNHAIILKVGGQRESTRTVGLARTGRMCLSVGKCNVSAFDRFALVCHGTCRLEPLRPIWVLRLTPGATENGESAYAAEHMNGNPSGHFEQSLSDDLK